MQLPAITAKGLPRGVAGVRRRWIVLCFALLVVASGLLRFVLLGVFPGNLMADEADNLSFIFQVLYGNGPGFFGLDWKPAPAFSMYVTAPFVALFGDSIFGLRFLSAAVSIIALFPLYALYRRHVSPAAALLSLALLTTSVWYLNFSRSGWENVDVVLITALAFWLLTIALESQRWRYWALAGAVASLGLYSYFSGRAVLLSMLAYAPFVLWRYRESWLRVLAGYLLLVVVALALFVPQLPSIAASPADFNRRAERVSALHAAETGYFGHKGALDVLGYQLVRNAQFFFNGSVLGGPSYSPPEQGLQDTRPRYSPFGRPLLEPVSAALFFLGMLLSLRRGGRYVMWWMMLLVPWVLTQVLTINTPDAARGIGMLPAIYFFVALAADGIWRAPVWKGFVRPALVVVVLAASIASCVTYFRWAGSQELLQAREPAIPLSQYDEWRAFQIQRAKEHLPPVPVTVWQQMRHG